MRLQKHLGSMMALAALIAACGGGDDGEVTTGMPPPRAERARPAAARATPTAAEEVPTEAASVVVRREYAEGARDPFERQYPENQTPIELEAVDLGTQEPIDMGPLSTYPVESLRLVAIITRTAEPKAMFMLPDGTGLGILARVNDRVGPNGTGRITDIQPNQVVISYEGFGFGETAEQARTLVLTLRDPSLNIEAEFEPY